jgi:N-acetylneuraminic acid mutarotase
MSEPLILMTKQLSEPLQNSVVRQSGKTTEITEGHRGLFLRLCASLCALWCFSAFAQPAWEPLPPLPEPNGGFIGGHHDGKIVIVGGTNWEGGKKNWLKSVRVFDPRGKVWGNMRNLERPLAYGVAMQNVDFFGFAGGSDGRLASKEVASLDGPYTDAHVLPQLPSTMVLSAGGTFGGGHCIFIGGTDDAANLTGVSRSVHALRLGKVERLADYPGKPFATAASAVVGAELFVFGGMNYDAEAKLPVNTAEAYAFSPEKNVWRKLASLAAPTRGLTAVTLDDGHIYIAGGYREDFTAEAVIYDVKTDSYHKAVSLPYAAMVGLVKMGDHVYCLGGEDKKQSRTDKFFRIPVAELLK